MSRNPSAPNFSLSPRRAREFPLRLPRDRSLIESPQDVSQEPERRARGGSAVRLGYARLSPVTHLPDGSTPPFRKRPGTEPGRPACFLAAVEGDALSRFEIEHNDVVVLLRRDDAPGTAIHGRTIPGQKMPQDAASLHGELVAVPLVDVLCAGRPLLPAEAPDADRLLGLFKAWQRDDDPDVLPLVGRAPMQDGRSIYTLKPGGRIVGTVMATRRACRLR